MNRQARRHPTHPLLPLLYPSKKSVVDEKREKKSSGVKLKQQLHRRKV